MTRRGWRSYDDGPFPDLPMDPPDGLTASEEDALAEAEAECARECEHCIDGVLEPGETMCRLCRGEEA